MGLPGGTSGKELTCQRKRQKRRRFSVVRDDPPEKSMATRSSIPAWRIPGTACLAGYSPWSHPESPTNEVTWHAEQACILCSKDTSLHLLPPGRLGLHLGTPEQGCQNPRTWNTSVACSLAQPHLGHTSHLKQYTHTHTHVCACTHTVHETLALPRRAAL